jgi:hypothetical protein
MSAAAHTHSDDIFIVAPKLEPFMPLTHLSCSVCGTTAAPQLARVWLYLTGRRACIYSVTYCPGGRAPVEDIASPLEAMMNGRSENRPRCGGIAEPHLHLKCNCCDFIRLMHTKS